MLRAKLQHQEDLLHVLSFLVNPPIPELDLKYPLYKALFTHLEEFGDHGHGALLAEHEGKKLELHPRAPYIRVITNGQLESTDVSLLGHFGIQRVDQLQAAMRNVLLSQHDLSTYPLPSDENIAIRVRSRVAQAKDKRLALAEHADATLLGRYHNEVTLVLQPSAPTLELTDSGDERLELVEHSLYVNIGTRREATTGDLRRLKMADPGQVEAAMGRLMVRLARIHGAPDAADTLELARKELLRRIGDVNALKHWIESPNDHPDLKRLLQVRALGKHPESVLVTKGSEELVLKEFLDRRGVIGTYRGMRLFVRKPSQSPTAAVEESIATIADLQRFDVATRAQFDAMALKVVESLDSSTILDVPGP